jgi:2-polyprenyl-3-methyl-5-hydroxy-6-metoxy-1,4-benzoquinol methylase
MNYDYDTSKSWQSALEKEGYEHHCFSKKDFNKIKRLGRVWQRILKIVNINPSSRIFEVGCGGGIHLATLALNGFEVHGIDVSIDVTKRAENYLKEVNNFNPINATVETADIFDYQVSDSYDMSFHFGVVEHFLDITQRQQIWNKLYSLTKPGGWIVSVVPCGQHIMREMVREKGLCGYNIPEIDYSCESHKREFEELNLSPIYVFTHNYFSFLSAHPSKFVSKIMYPFLFIVGNLVLPYTPLSENLKEKYAQTIVVVGQKPNNS